MDGCWSILLYMERNKEERESEERVSEEGRTGID